MTYIPHVPDEVRSMLDSIGVADIGELFDCIPERVRLKGNLNLPPALSEPELRCAFEDLAGLTRTDVVSFLGGGCYDHFVPAVVDALASRGEFLTAYTPYQPEASQGSLQAFFEYQTLICRLTGCEVSNASMYDGATAAAEAVLMALGMKKANRVALGAALHPEYRAVLETYLRHLGTEILTVEHTGGLIDAKSLAGALSSGVAAVVMQSPDFYGIVHNLEAAAEAAHAAGAMLIAVVDPISLGLLKRPGESGADIVVGDGQPLGNYRSFGGPAFGFMATSMKNARRMPGRLVGEAVDASGRKGYILTLQAREQHIRRGRATSNICTNHALCALRGAIYLSLMGPHGLRRVASLCLNKAHYAAEGLSAIDGVTLAWPEAPFFKEFVIRLKGRTAAALRDALLREGIDPGLDLGPFDDTMRDCLLVCVTEQRTRKEIDRMTEAVGREAAS